jgi:hypothetical protein
MLQVQNLRSFDVLSFDPDLFGIRNAIARYPGGTQVTLLEKSEIDCIGHGLIANVVGMKMVF